MDVLVADGAPAAVGTAGHEVRRVALLAELARIGVEHEEQDELICNAAATCGRVRNVVARVEGRQPGPGVLLLANYDSLLGGPSAADLSAVAAGLELMRALRAAPAERTVVFLAADSEVGGMWLGSRAFAERHRWMIDTAFSVHLEVRGMSGPSVLFDAGRADIDVLRAFAAASRRAIASSAFSVVPAPTDLSGVFRPMGRDGVCFGFLGDYLRYHTPLDTTRQVDLGTVQHLGDNVLEMVRARAAIEPGAVQPSVWFDLFAAGLVVLPASAMAVFAAVALVALVVAMIAAVRGHATTLGRILLGAGATLAIVIVTVVLGLALKSALRAAHFMPFSFVANPAPFAAAAGMLAVAAAAVVGAVVARRLDAWGALLGAWIPLVLAGGALAVLLPGLSYLFVLPAALALVLAAVVAVRGDATDGAAHGLATAAVATSGVLWLPLTRLLVEALGVRHIDQIAATVVVPVVLALPLLVGVGRGLSKATAGAALAAALGVTGIALVGGTHSRTDPQPLSVAYFEDGGTGESKWALFSTPPGTIADIDAVPQAIIDAGRFEQRSSGFLPWVPSGFLVAAAPMVGLPAPELSVLDDQRMDGKRTVRIRIHTPPDSRANLFVEPGAKIESVTFEGVAIPAVLDARRKVLQGWYPYRILTVPSRGVEMSFVTEGDAPIRAVLFAFSSGVPQVAAALARARDDAGGAACHDGDVTFVAREVSF